MPSELTKNIEQFMVYVTAQIYEISTDTHQLHYIKTAPLYNIFIIFDTVLRQKRNIERDK